MTINKCRGFFWVARRLITCICIFVMHISGETMYEDLEELMLIPKVNSYQYVLMVQILMKKPSIQPIHQNFVMRESRKNLGGTILRTLKSHTGTSIRYTSTALKTQLRNNTIFKIAIPRKGR
jgi:hypothetical protein